MAGGGYFIAPLAGVLLCFGLLFSGPVFASSIFLNEFHYDNVGTDVDEKIEIAGPAGTDLSGWSLVLYNGSGAAVYGSIALTGIIPDQQNGFGTLFFARSGLQNGISDGFALLHGDEVVQFLSYEGILKALDGLAAGMTSTDIGKSEPTDTPLGYSLQLTGTGSLYADFSWADAKPNSFGAVNSGQTFTTQDPIPTPEPGTFALFGIAATALVLLRKRLTS